MVGINGNIMRIHRTVLQKVDALINNNEKELEFLDSSRVLTLSWEEMVQFCQDILDHDQFDGLTLIEKAPLVDVTEGSWPSPWTRFQTRNIIVGKPTTVILDDIPSALLRLIKQGSDVYDFRYAGYKIRVSKYST